METIDFYVRFLARKFMMRTSGIRVHQILVFDENSTYCENVSTHTTINDIKKSIAIPEYRIEIRYSVNGKKLRAILRHDDDVHFPIRKELGIRIVPIVCALVVTKDGTWIDVTSRVRKYAGQNEDFNKHAGSTVFARDMFPFHDVDEYEGIVVETADHVLEFGMDDAIVILS
ncbi:hypothetical protein PBCVNEJV1_715L [Paramecium bursaria Chlorella virus NE-JV-1]|nr:hypothetical protein PBCVNEJV1_715L [Paramecium bursaria Chlorella virus NE-JV-1]